MPQESSPRPDQDFTIDQSTLSGNNQLGVHVGRDNVQSGHDTLQSGRDIVQNHGSGNLLKDVMINVFQTQGTDAAPTLTRQDYRNRQALLDKVENYWIKGVLEQSLQGQGNGRSPVPLDLELKPDAVIAPWRVVDQALDAQSKVLPPDTSIIDVFDELGTGRSLLILGSPGSGKTTMLLSLARDLIARCRQGGTQLIPVVFNLSSWTSRKQTIADWLIEELNSKYQVPKALGKNWIENQHLLFLLDGLDEVQIDDREACIEALNEFHQNYGPELAVCCRARNYALLKERLNFQAALCLRSLTDDQITNSIRHASIASKTDLTGLQQLLIHDTALREMAASPLMLTIMIAAYENLDDRRILDTSGVEKKRAELFNAYIGCIFQRRGTEDIYPRQQIIHWLTWLARNMQRTSQSVFLIENLHPDWLKTPIQKRMYRIGVKALLISLWGVIHLGLISALLSDPDPKTFDYVKGAFGAALGLSGGIVYGVIGGLLGGLVNDTTKLREGSVINGLLLGGIFGPLFWVAMLNNEQAVTYGIAYGVVYFLIGAYIYGLIHEIKGFNPIDTLRWSLRKALPYLPFSAIIAIALSLGTSITVWLSVVVGLMFLIIVGFENGKNIDQRTLPNYKIRQSVANAVKLFLLIAPLAGVPSYAIHGGSVYSGVANGVIFGMGAALIGAGGAGLNGIKHGVLRFILCVKGEIPWNYARFLDHACDRILLQRVGGGYMFIHRALLEHFASMQQSRH